MRVIKAVIFNLLGIILGILVGDIVFLIARTILIDWLGKLGWLTNILSWPVPYYLYALTGIAASHAASSVSVAKFFCLLGNTRFYFGTIIVGLYGIISYIRYLVVNFNESGFSFKILLVYLIMISFFVFATVSSLVDNE